MSVSSQLLGSNHKFYLQGQFNIPWPFPLKHLLSKHNQAVSQILITWHSDQTLKILLVNFFLSLVKGVFILFFLCFLVILLEIFHDWYLAMEDNLGKKELACIVKIPSHPYEKVRDHYVNLLRRTESYLSNVFQF